MVNLVAEVLIVELFFGNVVKSSSNHVVSAAFWVAVTFSTFLKASGQIHYHLYFLRTTDSLYFVVVCTGNCLTSCAAKYVVV